MRTLVGKLDCADLVKDQFFVPSPAREIDAHLCKRLDAICTVESAPTGGLATTMRHFGEIMACLKSGSAEP